MAAMVWPASRTLSEAADPVPGRRGGNDGGEDRQQAPLPARPAGTLGGVLSAADARQPSAQSAAAPSPFPPIADYAFLSDCHTGALVAPDGAIAWLCVPRFDAPSVFATVLDRQAGYFRLGPFGINHPTARVYEPGTNVLLTTWKTPTGWIEVRDALTMGPMEAEDMVTAHSRPPVDDDADHLLVRTVLPGGHRRARPGVRAGVRLRPDPGGVDAGQGQSAQR